MHSARHRRRSIGGAAPRGRIDAGGAVWRLGCLLLAAQAVVLLVGSVHLWQRFDLTSDFATFHQAWQQIGTGHLDPYLSTFAYNYPSYGYSFWRSHFELIMWPLALLWHVWPTSLTLLVVQDLAIVGAEVVTLRWGLELIKGKSPTVGSGEPRNAPIDAPGDRYRAAVIGGGLVVLLVANPWTYWTAWYDFHLQPFAILFTVLAGRSLWLGQRRGWVWVAATLLCGDVAATYILALGAAGLLVVSARRRSAGVILAGLAWLAVVSLVGAGKGSTLADRYGYLTSGAVGSGLAGIAAVVAGIVRHPHPAVHVLASRWREIYKYVAAFGTLGLLSGVGLFMAVIVLGANALNQSPVFIGATAGFQSQMAVVAGILGTTAVLAWLTTGRFGARGTAAAGVLGVALMVQALTTTIHWLPKVRTLSTVPPATAAALARVERQIPGAAEVIVSQGVIGRFGGHRWVYPYLDAFSDGQTIPLNSPTVAFVFTDAGIESATAAQTAAAVDVARSAGARVLSSGAGVTALIWVPPPSTRTMRFPR